MNSNHYSTPSSLVGMEQPTSNLDGLQSQDHSTCTLSNIYDLASNREECLLTASSIESMQNVQAPGWYMSPGSNKGVVLPGNDPDHSLSQPNNQIQPDNAFSNTTVTLSYVSRSHVFSPYSSVSQHSSLSGAPSVNQVPALQPTANETFRLDADVDGAQLCVEMDQHYLQQLAVPVGLATCTEAFEFLSPAHLAEGVVGFGYFPNTQEITDAHDGENTKAVTCKALHQDDSADCELSLDGDKNGSFSGLSSAEMLHEDHATSRGEQQGESNAELLLSPRGEQLDMLQDNGNFGGSLKVDCVSAQGDPVSISVTSHDEVDDVIAMPQATCFPRRENASCDETTEITTDEEVKRVSDLSVAASVNVEATELGGSSSMGMSPLKTNTTQQSMTDTPASEGKGGLSEPLSNGAKLAHAIDSNDCEFVKKKTFERKKLPPRSRRGTRLEAIVQNIYPARYRCSHVRSPKPSHCAKTETQPALEHCATGELSECTDDHHTPEEPQERSTPEKTEPLPIEGTCIIDVKRCESKESPTDTENSQSLPKYSCSANSQDVEKSFQSVNKSVEESQSVLGQPSVEVGEPSLVSRLEARHNSPTEDYKASRDGNGSRKAKAGHTPKRKRKKLKIGQSSLFSPQEPEIKLKYVNYKDEKRDQRCEMFSPFVHVEHKAFPSCSVINYPEDKAKLTKGLQQASLPCNSGVLPTTSCLQYGRVSAEATCPDSLVCCLCGSSANAAYLGDLHGPYYAEGLKPASKAPENQQNLKEDPSDSDSSSSAKSGRSAPVPHNWPRRSRSLLSQENTQRGCPPWPSDGDLCPRPETNRPKTDNATADWHRPPVLLLDSREYWLHEDCAIWTAGVFLVKGKVYGLEKAVKMAKEMICSMCSGAGATLGCFFKGCLNKYHYSCAAQADCFLNEENFSMKCTKHKNKSIKRSSVNQQGPR